MKGKALLAIVSMVIMSPLFGVVLADIVGYHEPLDIAAEELNLTEEDIYSTPFNDYSFPGLDHITGYIASGLLGVAIILSIGWLLKEVTAPGERHHR